MVAVVGDADRLSLVLIRDDCQNRPEDFLARDGHGVVDTREHRRLNIVALGQSCRTPGAASGNRRAVLDAGRNQRLDLVPLHFRHDRPDFGVGGVGIADLHLLSGGLGKRGCFCEFRRRHQHAARRVARLAGIAHQGLHALGHSAGKIGVVEDDVGRLAAQFLTDTLDGRMPP